MIEKLKERLIHYDGKPIDICAQIYNEFFDDPTYSKNYVSLFIQLCKYWGIIDSDNTIPVEEIYSDKEYDACLKKSKPMVDTILDNLVLEVLPEHDFYKKLLETLSNSTLFAQPIDRICAFYIAINSPKLPYFSLPLSKQMEDSTFAEHSEAVYPYFRKAYFVIHRGYTQFTQVSTQLLEILDEVENTDQRTVLLSMILAVFLRQGKQFSSSEDTSEES